MSEANDTDTNGAARTARTRGSLTAPHGQSEIVTLVPNSPPFSVRAARNHDPGGVCPKCKKVFEYEKALVTHISLKCK